MLVTYMRSSSVNSYAMCPQKYFCTYVLGLKDKDNGKACQGNVFHKNFEILAKCKLAQQNGEKYFIDDNFGKLSVKIKIEKINKLSYDYYESEFPGLMPKGSEKTVLEWTHAALLKLNGEMDPRNQNIYAVEEFFDVEVPHSWADYSYELNGETISGRLRLKGTVDLITREDEVYLHLVDYKGLPIETPIPTPDGWTTMGDLKVGDLVFDQYGKPTRVEVKTEEKIKECYKITFDDTSTVICDDEHYWKLSNDSVVQISKLEVGDTINVADPIECEEKVLPIDPYTLGIWLGDGRNRSGDISSGDKFVFEEIERRGYKVGNNTDTSESKCEARTAYGLTTQLRKENLLHNKHIPEIYFRASYEQRLDLLRGLMDSDGSANKTRKQCIFMNCRKELSDDVKRLLLTLGQRALVSKTIAKGFGLVVDAYPVSFRPVDINPFLLPIKRDKVDKRWGPGKSDVRKVKSIEKVGERITQCISVDSPDKTYLCTENMIPTHNTGRRFDWAKETVKEYSDLESDKQLLLYYYALRLKYPNNKFYVSIYYANDHIIDKVLVPGGLFTFVFDDDTMKLAEDMLRKEFEKIKNDRYPRVISKTCAHFKCKYLCAYSKIIPEISTEKPACIFLREEISEKGIEYVTQKYGDLQRMKVYSGGGKLNVELKDA